MMSTSSAPDGAFHDLLARFSVCGETVRARGGGVRVDAVGNQFGLFRPAEGTGAPLVMMGSHLDRQVTAGRLDGTLGVAAALCIAGALMRAARAGERVDADFCTVNWANEEGARFRPRLLGSGTDAGWYRVGETFAGRDESGVGLGDALAAIGYRGTDAAPPLPTCDPERHVEQGTVLEEAGATIGIVTHKWGATKIEAVFAGEPAHTGPCPMERRRDALLGAAYAVAVDDTALAEATRPADLDAGLAVQLWAAHRLCHAGGDPIVAGCPDLGDPA